MGGLRSRLSTFEEQFRRSLLYITLYSLPAFFALRPGGVVDPDIWWHLRTGQWIAEHRGVPYVDFFSSYGMGKPWFAYSWLFEILVYALFSRLGLMGVLVYVYVLLLGITGAVHALVRKLEPRIARSAGLTALALFAMSRLFSPRPWLFSILFFALELNILVSVRRSRNYRALLLLPPLFIAWSNLHIQFVYGLLALGLAALEDPINRFQRHRRAGVTVEYEGQRPLPIGKMVLVIPACLLATLVNPYHFRIYAVVLDFARQSGLYNLISELGAMQFRTLPDWLVLFLTLGGVYAVSRCRALSLFWGMLLLAGTFISFRSSRDVWFVTIIATATISATSCHLKVSARDQISNGQILFVALAICATLWLAILAYHISNTRLQELTDKTYPASAASFVEERGLRGPLYNHFDWGGYLIWRLRNEPVSIDGRNNVNDAERVMHSLRVWGGGIDWISDSELSKSRLIIGEKNFALMQLLRSDPRFEAVYEDEIAIVFVARNK